MPVPASRVAPGMTDPEKWARAVKDVLSWSGDFMPLPLGYVLLFILTVLSAGFLIRSWRGK